MTEGESMRSRTIAIGDVHGCSRALEILLGAIEPKPDDVIVTLGDYVNRGPDSRGVLKQLIALERQCDLIPLLGNHDQMFLQLLLDAAAGHSRVLSSWLRMGGDATLASYGATPGKLTGADLARVPAEHVMFLERCRAHHETETHIFIHAKYDPVLSMNDQPFEVLRWESLRDSIPGPHFSGKTVIAGHTSQKSGEILDVGHLVCVDTFCFGGGWLTALDVHTAEVWQTNRQGELRSTISV
jgi:serine/threonine protein phosphatase 1